MSNEAVKLVPGICLHEGLCLKNRESGLLEGEHKEECGVNRGF